MGGLASCERRKCSETLAFMAPSSRVVVRRQRRAGMAFRGEVKNEDSSGAGDAGLISELFGGSAACLHKRDNADAIGQ